MKTLCLIGTLLLFLIGTTGADTVILKSGDKFTTKKAWEENGKIKFYMQGLVVSVPQKDVRQIVSDTPGNTQIKDDPPVEPRVTPAASQQNTAPEKSGAGSQPLIADRTSATKVPPPASTKKPAEPQQRNSPRDPGAGKNDRIDFGGLQWGVPVDSIKGLTKRRTVDIYGGIDEYYRPDDPLTLGNTSLDGVMLGFWRNRLYTITLWTDGYSQFNRLKTEAFKRYGKAIQNNPEKDKFLWYGETTDKLLEFDEKSKAGILWMRSRLLDKQRREIYPD
ncbi:MAG: hypothetical protein HKM93_05720 [Desulfobacteraceae bacterium]|nr:hypothetical protein [Desulfobacteraceae bacterium]